MKLLEKLLLVPCLASPSALAAPLPLLPPTLQLEAVEADGNGCPQGKIKAEIKSDRKTITLTFTELKPAFGPGVSPVQSRKTCNAKLSIKVPDNHHYAITGFDSQVAYELDEGAVAVQSFIYFFGNAGQKFNFANTVPGPFRQTKSYSDKLPPVSQIWSPCGLPPKLSLNVSQRVHNRNARAFPHATGKVKDPSKQIFTLSFALKKCVPVG